jgi:glycosyltransferase involved in cell wall biosynthesis
MEVRTRRVALVHDFLVDLRGAERVFAVLCDLFPQAELFTTVYDERGTDGRFAGRLLHTTALQRLHPTARTFRALMPLYPTAIESLDLRDFDLVVSSSSAWAHGAIAGEDARHLCYCHNPFRYAWNEREATLARCPAPARPALAAILHRWRIWDAVAAQRVDRYVANSATTARRVRRAYGRDADVLSPPVETHRFAPGTVGRDYLVVSELMPHKHLDVAVQAFTRLGLPLVVIGKGPDIARLRRMAGPTVRFAGHLPDAGVAQAMAEARALVVTAAEEFGIAAVEAQAAGRPVIALRSGGVTTTVREGTTGVFYERSDPDDLARVLRAFDPLDVDPQACVASARRFDVAVFRRAFLDLVNATRPRDVTEPRRRPPVRRRGLAQAG